MESYWDGKDWLTVFIKENSTKYFLNGELHRNNGPAKIIYSMVGEIKNYYMNGLCHRDDGPAVIHYYINGDFFIVYYFQNDKQHREDGPAKIIYNNDGSIYLKQYWFNDKQHREDGPAQISYKNKIINEEEYYFNGKKIKLEYLPFDFPIDTEEKKLYMRLKYGE